MDLLPDELLDKVFLAFVTRAGCRLSILNAIRLCCTRFEMVANVLREVPLDMGNCFDLKDSHVRYFATRWPFLRFLDLTECAMISDCGVASVVKRCSNLRSLILAGCWISGSGLCTPSSSCRASLCELVLSYCSGVRGSMLGDIVAQYPVLKTLKLRYFAGFKDYGLKPLAERCRGCLRTLDISYCAGTGDPGVSCITESCKGLVSLDLSYAHLLSDEGLGSLGANCANLRELSIDYCSLISDVGVAAVARGCRQLRVLSASFCSRLTDVGLESLSQFCPGLLSLCIRGTRVGDGGLQSITRGCRKLTCLSLNHCSLIGDDGLVGVSKACTDLKSIGLRGCVGITDITLVSVATHCLSLVWADFSYCSGISDNGLSSSSFRGLRWLNLSGCGRVTHKELVVNQGQAGCPGIEFLRPEDTEHSGEARELVLPGGVTNDRHR